MPAQAKIIHNQMLIKNVDIIFSFLAIDNDGERNWFGRLDLDIGLVMLSFAFSNQNQTTNIPQHP